MLESVAGGSEHISAVTGDGGHPIYRHREGRWWPMRLRWLDIYRRAHQPAMKEAAIPYAPISNIKNFRVTHDGERRSLHLNPCSEGRAVVLSRRLHVRRPAWVNGARVHVKRNDVMFLR